MHESEESPRSTNDDQPIDTKQEQRIQTSGIDPSLDSSIKFSVDLQEGRKPTGDIWGRFLAGVVISAILTLFLFFITFPDVMIAMYGPFIGSVLGILLIEHMKPKKKSIGRAVGAGFIGFFTSLFAFDILHGFDTAEFIKMMLIFGITCNVFTNFMYWLFDDSRKKNHQFDET